MLSRYFTAASPQQLPLGKSADGRQVYHSFRPSAVQLALMMNPHLGGVATVADVLPLPRGMTIARNEGDRQLQLVLADCYTRHLRRVFGYVGEIKLSDGEGTLTPAQLQVIIMVPWRYAVIE